MYAADTHIYPRKFKMYFDAGLGYQSYKLRSSTTWKAYNNGTEKEVSTLAGLGARLSLGATQKVGEGKIYFELVAGRILYGVAEKDFLTPSPNPFFTNYNTQHSGASPSQNDLDFLGINLGYCYYL